jgi:hypothetical protein
MNHNLPDIEHEMDIKVLYIRGWRIVHLYELSGRNLSRKKGTNFCKSCKGFVSLGSLIDRDKWRDYFLAGDVSHDSSFESSTVVRTVRHIHCAFAIYYSHIT